MKLIFNASMPRSGSELLQVALHQNPRIYGSVTSPLLEYQYAMRGNYELPEVKSQDPVLMQKAFLAACKGTAEGYYSELTDRPIACDKNRGWSHYYEWVSQWNPNPKMICMVRDPRSMIASMERAYRKNRHTNSGPDNPAKIEGMTVGQRAQHWLVSQPIGLAMQRTIDCFQRGVAKDMLFIRYEDFTRAPDAEMKRLYDFIGEAYFQHDFKNLVKQVHEDDSHFGVYGNHDVKPVMTPAKPRDWEDVLTPDIAKAVRQFASQYAELFGY